MRIGDMVDLVKSDGPGKIGAIWNMIKNASVDAVLKVAGIIGGGIVSAILYIRHLLKRKTKPTEFDDSELSPVEQIQKSNFEFEENERLSKKLNPGRRPTHRLAGWLEKDEVDQILKNRRKRGLTKEEKRKLDRHYKNFAEFYHVYPDGFCWAKSDFLEGSKPIYIPGKGFVNRLEAWKEFDIAPISETNNYDFREFVLKNYPEMRKSFGF